MTLIEEIILFQKHAIELREALKTEFGGIEIDEPIDDLLARCKERIKRQEKELVLLNDYVRQYKDTNGRLEDTIEQQEKEIKRLQQTVYNVKNFLLEHEVEPPEDKT